ncbi:MAG: hypothetical protein BroJett025_02940 [Patescibacteria group bacterium]|nr:MAG: hypothetical protein BroJett025_02940 [Patescibacteria group bacterium]
MEQQTISQLNQLNYDFYKITAIDFDDSRHYFWNGWEKIPPLLDRFSDIRVADIGCGNGRFGQFLVEKCSQLKFSYTGVDANITLLDFAHKNLKGKIPALHLQHSDIITALQNNEDFLGKQNFQLISSFGVFHHVPSFELRLKLLKYLLSKLTKDGYLIISFWQFMNFERFRKKIITDQNMLAKKNIDLEKLEAGDYILDWKRGKFALRYCHFIDEAEQLRLVDQAQGKLIKTYLADGTENVVNQYTIITHKN